MLGFPGVGERAGPEIPLVLSSGHFYIVSSGRLPVGYSEMPAFDNLPPRLEPDTFRTNSINVGLEISRFCFGAR